MQPLSTKELNDILEETSEQNEVYKSYYQAGYSAAVAEFMRFVLYMQNKKPTPTDLLKKQRHKEYQHVK